MPLSDLTLAYVAERMSTVKDEVVECVCAPCNNGWMQNLDSSFAGTIERWVRGGTHRLGPTGVAVVRRYLLKVMWVRLLGEQWSQGAIRNGELIAEVVLNPRFGASIRGNDMSEVSNHLSMGAAKVGASTCFTHAGFTPRVAGVGHRAGLRRFSGGLVVALPKLELQLWLIYRFTPTMRTSWPAGISWLAAGSRFDRLGIAPAQPLVDHVELAMG